jgi:hypothetical protein
MILVPSSIEHDRTHPKRFGPISEELAGGSSPLDPHVLTLSLEVGEIGTERGQTHQRPPSIVVDDLTLEIS